MTNSFSHYKKLFFFLKHRFEPGNYKIMRDYLSSVMVEDVLPFIDLHKKCVLDVGGSSGEFSAFLEKKFGCNSTNLDPFPPKGSFKKTVKAFADDLPFKQETFDFVVCRGVLEHISKQKRTESVNEIYRVLKKGGVAYMVIPPWFNPHAGHMLKPFHVLPFPVAKFLRKIFFSEDVQGNSYAEATLFPITFNEAKKLFIDSDFKIEKTLDTHLRLHFLTRIPLLRELAVPAVAFILRKPLN